MDVDHKKKTSVYPFYAMLDRMQYISRWGLMRNSRQENTKEHSMDVAIVAHALCVIYSRHYKKEDDPVVDPLYVMARAVFHDATEIITGDLPTPIKYKSRALTTAYKDVEGEAAETLLGLLPPELQPDYKALFSPDLSDPAQAMAHRFVKAADSICAYTKCLTEERTGNSEFSSAKISILAKIKRFGLPEVDYYMDHFVPAYGMTLDQISR